MTRLDGALVSAVKYFRPKADHTTDLLPSAIHYKVTFGVLLGCAILTGLTSWYSPIECMRTDSDVIDSSMLKQWCYSQSIFVVEGQSATDEIFPGVGNLHANPSNRMVPVRYYQWVTLCLLLQAACFQVPHILWKAMESGRVRRLLDRLHALEMLAPNQREASIRDLATLFVVRPAHDSKRYLNWFVTSQVLYFVNALAQILLTQHFLNNQFILLLPRWASGESILDVVFPKIVKCSVRNYGPGGDPQSTNVLCLLAMNILNEKIYLLLWGVLMVALLTSIAQVGYVLASMSSWRLRAAILQDVKIKQKMNLLKGEWLLLNFVKNSLDNSLLFSEFFDAIARARDQQATELERV